MKAPVILLCCIAMVGCSAGYQKRRDGWVYVEWNAGVGHQVSPVVGADAASFRILSDPNFAVDARSVYWRNWKLEGADPATFRQLTKGYWRDRRKVFDGHLEVVGADPDTFRLLPVSPWPVDKNDAYRGYQAVHAEDIQTFEALSFHYARDAKAYYASGAPNKKMIVPCDYPSFRILNAVYAKDKATAFWLGFPIAGSDPDTFVAIDEARAKDRFREYQGPTPK